MDPIQRLKEAFAGNEHVLTLIQEENWSRLGSYVLARGNDRQKDAWTNAEAHLKQRHVL